jgi:hypothetical protein
MGGRRWRKNISSDEGDLIVKEPSKNCVKIKSSRQSDEKAGDDDDKVSRDDWMER